MAVPEASENRVLDAVLLLLQGIGTPAGSWLTAPTVAEGIPPDIVPVADKTVVYLHHVRTDETPPEAGVRSHYFRLRYAVWIFGPTPRVICSVKADVLRALFAGEGSLTTAFAQPAFPSEFVQLDDMSHAGAAAGRMDLFIDLEISHSAP